MGQLSIDFDATPRQLGQVGEDRAIGAASSAWREAALNALVVVCRTHDTFLVDAVWARLGERTDHPDKRAMAGILREGEKRSWCAKTGQLVRSSQMQCHGNLRSEYRSLIG